MTFFERVSRALGVHIPEPKVLERNFTPGKESVTIGTDEPIMQYHETGTTFISRPLLRTQVSFEEQQ